MVKKRQSELSHITAYLICAGCRIKSTEFYDIALNKLQGQIWLIHCVQGFIDSIRELLDVRSHAEELHAEISNVDANVKETTEG